MGAYFPIICIILCETRATVILRRKAHHLRHTLTGFSARFTAKSEIEKVKFSVALQQSLLRPISKFPSHLLLFVLLSGKYEMRLY
jgi:hypothetical protein